MSNFKLNYKPTKNEFLLLIGLLIVALIALSLNFLLLSAMGYVYSGKRYL